MGSVIFFPALGPCMMNGFPVITMSFSPALLYVAPLASLVQTGQSILSSSGGIVLHLSVDLVCLERR